MRNSNIEYRNAKQYQMTEIQNSKSSAAKALRDEKCLKFGVTKVTDYFLLF